MLTAALIRSARTRAKLSQVALARAAGTSQPAIARYESGKSEPRADTLQRILAACGERLTTQSAPARHESVPAAGPRGRLLRRRHGEVLAAVAEVGLLNPRVFGSTSRGEDTATSDLDILVDLGPHSDVLAIYELKELLVPLLGAQVDVTCPEILRPEVLAGALADSVPL
jgi:predicted nucleotidyltransferase/DNA-binding XRE family transcriptional regulator